MTMTLLPTPRRVPRRVHSGIATLLIAAAVGCGGDSPVNFKGDYEIDGGQLTLIDGAGNEAQATLRNGTITVGLDLVGNGTLKQYTFQFVP